MERLQSIKIALELLEFLGLVVQLFASSKVVDLRRLDHLFFTRELKLELSFPLSASASFLCELLDLQLHLS